MWAKRAGAALYCVGLGCLALLVVHCPSAKANPSTGHGFETKSIAQAYLECLQYLNISRQSMYAYDPEAVPLNSGGNCLMRCIGINTRWWCDEDGVNEQALVQFFRRADGNALEEAHTCLEELEEPSDECAAAYRSFRCYSDALGEVIAHPEYMAPRRDEIRRAVVDCSQMLQVSDDQLETCVKTGTFLGDGSTSCFLRCVITRLGLYSDSTGMMADRVQLLMDKDTAQTWTEINTNEAVKCESDLRVFGADACEVAALSVETCFGRKAFADLWTVLTEDYGTSEDVVEREASPEEPEVSFEELNLSEEPEQQENTQEERAPKFKIPSKLRLQPLMIITPAVYTVDEKTFSQATKNEIQKSEQQEDLTEEYTEKPAQEEKDPEQPGNFMPENILMNRFAPPRPIRSRLQMYPAQDELLPMYNQAHLYPYADRMRRSVPYGPQYPNMMPMMEPCQCHSMGRPMMKRSIPVMPMFAPAYPEVAPFRAPRHLVAEDVVRFPLQARPTGVNPVGAAEPMESVFVEENSVPALDVEPEEDVSEPVVQVVDEPVGEPEVEVVGEPEIEEVAEPEERVVAELVEEANGEPEGEVLPVREELVGEPDGFAGEPEAEELPKPEGLVGEPEGIVGEPKGDATDEKTITETDAEGEATPEENVSLDEIVGEAVPNESEPSGVEASEDIKATKQEATPQEAQAATPSSEPVVAKVSEDEKPAQEAETPITAKDTNEVKDKAVDATTDAAKPEVQHPAMAASDGHRIRVVRNLIRVLRTVQQRLGISH